METKSLKGWMQELGYKWVEGAEQMSKGLMSKAVAETYMSQLVEEGAVIRG